MSQTDFTTKLSLTGILVEDEKDGGFTAFFAEFPEAVAEGDTEQEAQKNLFDAFATILAFKREEGELKMHDGHHLIKKFDFQLEPA